MIAPGTGVAMSLKCRVVAASGAVKLAEALVAPARVTPVVTGVFELAPSTWVHCQVTLSPQGPVAVPASVTAAPVVTDWSVPAFAVGLNGAPVLLCRVSDRQRGELVEDVRRQRGQAVVVQPQIRQRGVLVEEARRQRGQAVVLQVQLRQRGVLVEDARRQRGQDIAVQPQPRQRGEAVEVARLEAGQAAAGETQGPVDGREVGVRHRGAVADAGDLGQDRGLHRDRARADARRRGRHGDVEGVGDRAAVAVVRRHLHRERAGVRSLRQVPAKVRVPAVKPSQDGRALSSDRVAA